LDFPDDHALTEKIIGCAMKVHRQLGPGFLESVYRNALAFELRRAGLAVELEKHIP
jgi:GxxExxY protein